MPNGVAAYWEGDSVRILWNAALDSNGNAVAGYNIYRANAPAGPYSRVNAELVTGTEFVDTEGAVGIAEGGGGSGGSYYGVTAVDSFGDESAQSLGISPASIAAAAGGAAGGCFIGTVGGSIPAGLFWILAIFTIAVIFAHWRTTKKHSAPVESSKGGPPKAAFHEVNIVQSAKGGTLIIIRNVSAGL